MDPMNEPMSEEPQGKPEPWRLAAIYGFAMAAALFFIGWVTGMGGSTLPNLIFSGLMGVFAAGLFWLVLKYRGAK